jgi:hypothetical protein
MSRLLTGKALPLFYSLDKCSLIDNRPSLRDSRGRAVSARAPSVIVLPARTEVFVSTERDQSPTTQTSRTSYVSTKPQRSQKAHEVSLDDMERGLEK